MEVSWCGGIEVSKVRSLNALPLRPSVCNAGIKREAIEWALAMIIGRNAKWKVVCKDALRASNVTQVHICLIHDMKCNMQNDILKIK